MKLFFTYIVIFFSLVSFGQITSDFNIDEAKYTIAMCNSFSFLKQFGTTETLIPNEFNLTYTSDILSMDNKFQIYENENVGVIVYRGSTDRIISWVENCYSAMIPAKGTITIKEQQYKYLFSEDENAAVHAGYALTVVILSEKIKEQIKLLNTKGIYNIIITGHSQGGALATLTRAYLEHLPKGELSSENKFKTYAYAQPMCGNKEFAEEYNTKFSKKGTSYFIKNPKDPIPYMPFNYEEGTLITKEKLTSWLFGTSKFNIKKLGQDAFIRLFEKGITGYVKGTNKLLDKVLDMKFGEIEMPEFVADINYYPSGNVREIASFTYPKIEINITNLNEKERKNLVQDVDGKWYKKETKFFQHKPYNYYVYLLKKWDKKAYNKLDKRYLITDL